MSDAKVVKPRNVYQLISEVSAELSKEGIAKGRKNAQQGYSFRGIDEVLNALAPIVSKVGLVILPRILSREATTHQSKAGGSLFYVVVHAEFDFVSAHDGSKHTVTMYGEAMDSADKATNKAMSAAYKYAAIQTFCIPIEGDNDADAVTHSIAPTPPPKSPAPVPKQPGMPAGTHLKANPVPSAHQGDKTTQPTAAPTTANGHEKGTITDAQLKAVHAILNEIGAELDEVNMWCESRFGCRLSGLATNQASTVIDVLMKRKANGKPLQNETGS